MRRAYSALLPASAGGSLLPITAALDAFPDHFHAKTAAAGCRIRPLERGQTYKAASPELAKLGVDVDAWPVAPAGLFVVAERTVYLRSISPLTIAHEYGHAVDCALGGGVYLSTTDLRIREAFRNAREFVTPYAATGLDEFFAECLRAFVEVNDGAGPWPKATKARLRAFSPAMFDFFAEVGP